MDTFTELQKSNEEQIPNILPIKDHIDTIPDIYKHKSELLRVEILGLQNVINRTTEITKRQKLNKRVKIDTGKFCNARCNFCYYLDRVKERDFLTIDEVMERRLAEDLLERGIREFEFSGGEPTLCWDLGEIIKYIRYIAKESYSIEPHNLHFSIVTNGTILRDKYKPITNKDHGQKIITPPEYMYVEEILFSLHGHRELHQSITKLNNSYDKIVDFIDEWIGGIVGLGEQIPSPDSPDLNTWNLNSMIKKIRINIVVGPETFIPTAESQRFIRMILGYMKAGIQINLLPMNAWDCASNQIAEQAFYEGITDGINYFLSNLHLGRFMLTRENLKYRFENGSNLFNIRYFSPCLIKPKYKAYTQFIVNHYDHLFDRSDWNKVLYPEEQSSAHTSKIYKNVYSPLNINPASMAKAFFKDANQSHYVDRICADCNQFKNLKCDGQKYTNQKTNQIIYNTKEIRTQYVNSQHPHHSNNREHE